MDAKGGTLVPPDNRFAKNDLREGRKTRAPETRRTPT